MTTQFARGSTRAPAFTRIETPFDWSDRALLHPKILVVGAKGSGKRQYLASLPYAPINWDSRENILGVVPAGPDTVARMANALYYVGEISDEGGPSTYNVFVRQRTVRREGLLGGKHVMLADVPSLVMRDTGAMEVRLDHTVWHDNGPLSIGNETLPIQDQLGTAIGIVFVIDPFVPAESNAFVGDLLEAIEAVYEEWRQAGVSSVPSADRPLPVAVVATKTDALHPGDPRLDDVIRLHDIIGGGQADRVNACDFKVHCAGVSAWGEGPGVRRAGTRFEPTGVLKPIRELFASFPRLFGAHIWDIASVPE